MKDIKIISVLHFGSCIEKNKLNHCAETCHLYYGLFNEFGDSANLLWIFCRTFGGYQVDSEHKGRQQIHLSPLKTNHLYNRAGRFP